MIPNYVIPDEGGLQIDLKDLLAHIILKWKFIVLCMIFVGLLGYGVALLRGSNTESLTATSARALITEDKAEDVDQLFNQYQYYTQYRRTLMNDYTYLFSDQAAFHDNLAVLNARYFVDSDIVNLDHFFSTLTLDETDYEKLREIAPDEESFSPIYQRVQLSVDDLERASTRSSSSVNNNITFNEIGAGKYLFTVAIFGISEEQCEEMLSIVQAALAREIGLLSTADPDIRFSFLSKQFSHDVLAYLQSLQNLSNTRITQVDNQLNNIATKVTKFTSGQRDYYNLLVQQAEQESQPGKHVSWKKWTVIGSLMGAFLAVGIFFLQYLFDGTIKISAESESIFQTQTLQNVFIPGKKNLFGKWVSRLTGADNVSVDEKIALLAADIQLLMKKAGYQRLFLLSDSHDINASQTAARVAEAVVARNPNLELLLGNPTVSIADLEKFSASENTIVFSELKHSRRTTLIKWSELCIRHQLHVIGVVPVAVCW